MRPYLVRFAAGLLAVVLIAGFLAYTFLLRSEESFWPNETFSAERWNALPGDQRYLIANDLLQSRILDGMSKDDVIALLGRPDPGGTKEDGTVGDNISFYLKSGSTTVSFNAVWFIRILFDPVTGKVQRYLIAGD